MSRSYKKHGLARTPLYKIWLNIKDRCFNPKNPYSHNYLGRGISICDEWKDDFAAFVEAIGPRPTPQHTVERINNDVGYQPGNVRWATRKEQARNMRKSAMLTVNGRTQCVAAWAEEIGLAPSTIWTRRFVEGMSDEDAVLMPRRTGGKRPQECAA